MAKRCAKCGRSGFTLTLLQCAECHRKVCDTCFINRNYEGMCVDCHQHRMSSTSAQILGRWGGCCPICGETGSLNLSNLYFYRMPYLPGNGHLPPLNHDFTLKCTRCWNEINEHTLGVVNEAHRAERSGRYEDAANSYEKLNLLDKARSLRERNRVSTVRQVNVNINSLIDQLRTGGLTVPYRCQGCGATITIDSKVGEGGMRYCSYCGSAIDTELLARMIQQALNY